MEDNSKKVRLTIILIFVLFIIGPLLIGIGVLLGQNKRKITEEEALNTSIKSEVAQAIAEENDVNLDDAIIHSIVSDGDWLVAGIFSKNASDFGNSAIIIMRKDGDEFETIEVGSNFDNDTLLEEGVPKKIIRAIEETDLMSEYSEIIYGSNRSPRVRYPLISKLPYKTDNLLIDYYFEDGLTDDDGVGIPIIEIVGTDAAERNRALNAIRDFGFDPGDYRIVFRNFNNHFVEGLEEEIEVENGAGGEMETNNEEDGEGP